MQTCTAPDLSPQGGKATAPTARLIEGDFQERKKRWWWIDDILIHRCSVLDGDQQS